MSKKVCLLGILSLIFSLSGCSKNDKDKEGFGPSPGDGKSQVQEPDEGFGPSPRDGKGRTRDFDENFGPSPGDAW
ncbi:hypothetical protein [Simkania sp.]|uniref:hypothetical protein n=1 Tax=Simkania sp. TaxID=34094 RepID=UPI003B525201